MLRDAVNAKKKNTNESLAILLRHAAMVIQVLLQVCESAFYLVVCIGHSLTRYLLACEKVWQSAIFCAYTAFCRISARNVC